MKLEDRNIKLEEKLMAKSKFDRISLKALQNVDDRPRGSFMDPKLADLHHKIDRHHIAMKYSSQKKRQKGKHAAASGSVPRIRPQANSSLGTPGMDSEERRYDYTSLTSN